MRPAAIPCLKRLSPWRGSRALAPLSRQQKSPTGLRRCGEVLGAAKDIYVRPSFRAPQHRCGERGASKAPALMSRYCPRRAKKRDYFFAAFAGAFLAGAAFFTGAEDFAAAALTGALAGAAFFAAGFAAAFAAGFLAGAAFFAGAALALAGAAFFTAGFAAAFAAGFFAGAAFALGAAAFGLAAGAAFFTAVAAFAAAAFTGAFFAGALDAGALDDCLAMRCPLRCCRWPLVTRRVMLI